VSRKEKNSHHAKDAKEFHGGEAIFGETPDRSPENIRGALIFSP